MRPATVAACNQVPGTPPVPPTTPPVAERVPGRPASPPALNFRLHNYSNTNAVQYLMARVRLAIDPPPTTTTGTPETY